MSTEDNIETIRTVYEAFQLGDVPAILDHLADDVDWAAEAAGTGAPWYGVRIGKDAVAAFFTAFAEAMEPEEFTPVAYAGNDDGQVMSIVHMKVKARATGKRAEMDLHHWFQFRDGKIVRYRGTEDSAQTIAALTA